MVLGAHTRCICSESAVVKGSGALATKSLGASGCWNLNQRKCREGRNRMGHGEVTGSAMHYDEDEVLTRYVLDHYGHLMTQLERRAIRAIRAEEKARNSQDERMASMIRKSLWWNRRRRSRGGTGARRADVPTRCS